jgi:putative AlgH/UPF0301 family transcriptional regulator
MRSFLLLFLPAVSSFCPLSTDHHHHGLFAANTKTTFQQRTRLFQTEEDGSAPLSLSASLSNKVRFMGRGPHAVVRPGVVLLAPPDEFHHFLRKAAVFIYAMGLDDDDVYVIRGVIIDQPTPFTMQEMMKQDTTTQKDAFLQNLIYRGGEKGDAAFMLHADQTLGDATESEMIGTSGIYQGGMNYALSNEYALDSEKVKFFFSYMEFTEKEIEGMLESREDERTAWVSVEAPHELVLSSDWDRGDAWARLRNVIRNS